MPFTNVLATPEGGHQDPKAWAAAWVKLNPTREPARCMFPYEFSRIIWENRHSRFDSCGIASTRHGNNPRKDHGLDPHGTVWFSKPQERRWTVSIPSYCIPYSTLRTAIWNEANSKWEKGELKRGWRNALSLLVKTGYLAPSDSLSHLIGENTYTLFPARLRR